MSYDPKKLELSFCIEKMWIEFKRIATVEQKEAVMRFIEEMDRAHQILAEMAYRDQIRKEWGPTWKQEFIASEKCWLLSRKVGAC